MTLESLTFVGLHCYSVIYTGFCENQLQSILHFFKIPSFASLCIVTNSVSKQTINKFHIHTVHLDVIKVLFIHQLMH